MAEAAKRQEIVEREDRSAEVMPLSDIGRLFAVVERAAANPDFSIEMFERTTAMIERLQAAQARKAFNKAMSLAQAEMPQVARNANNTQTQSRYSTIDKVNDAIVPVYTKHGFSLSFGMGQEAPAGHYRVTCTVAHDDGHERVEFADLPIDATGIQGKANKTGTHAFGSTMSYGRRYLTLLIFNVTTKDATVDDDGNAAGAQAFVSDDQVATIDSMLAETKTDRAAFLKWAKAERVEDIEARHYPTVIARLQEKLAAKVPA